ncbi:hypothetical protein ATPR_3344 [Acetobacter tropicalis NBRC 101654]|uniref:Uncharacterized protein n=1 Tax=Acetobacter tropicalis NBRC 101654 TaxID=749388 RepID=F7VIZ5_9PROT|nr:hypothetical protein ATPR_3344 [Acetobacter tropicalis NBRC 101654]
MRRRVITESPWQTPLCCAAEDGQGLLGKDGPEQKMDDVWGGGKKKTGQPHTVTAWL